MDKETLEKDKDERVEENEYNGDENEYNGDENGDNRDENGDNGDENGDNGDENEEENGDENEEENGDEEGKGSVYGDTDGEEEPDKGKDSQRPSHSSNVLFITEKEEQDLNVEEDENEEDVTAEPNENEAILILDNLSSTGEISEATADYYRNKYLMLQENLSKSNINVLKLQEEYSRCNIRQEGLSKKLDDAEKYPEKISGSAVMTSLRESCLNARNKTDEVEERIVQYKRKIESLNAEKSHLEREISKQPKPGEIEAKIKELNKYVVNLKKDIQQHYTEIKLLEVEREDKLLLQEKNTKDYTDLRDQFDITQNELYQVAPLPNQLAKEADKIYRKMVDEIDIAMQQILNEKHRRFEFITILTRNIEKDARDMKTAELHMKIAKDNINHLHHILLKITQTKELVPAEDDNRTKKIKDLNAENEVKMQQLNAQNKYMDTQNLKFEKSIQHEQLLLEEFFEGDLELQELSRLAVLKTIERDKKARDKNRADSKYRCAKEELKSKYALIDENRKKLKEKKARLKMFAEKYEDMKGDRNKYVTLIQGCTQKISEFRQKIKIIQNEMEILRTAVIIKDKQLHKERLTHMHILVLRDALREDVDKHHRKVIELEAQCEQQKVEIKKFNYMINQAEEHMIKLRKRYENAIQERNKKGEWLIKVNSEVCLFYEKFNVQGDMITKGNSELENFEQELKIMHLEKSSLLREINVLDRQLPERRPLNEKLRILQLELSEWSSRGSKLAKCVVERESDKYTRYLEGENPSPSESSKKMEKLQVRLTNIEKEMMEKELLIKQVTRLLERIKRKSDQGKEDTLKLAKNINDIKHKIREATRKMMSMTAELSMKQANSIMLQHDIKKDADLIELCYANMAEGESPCEAIVQEWNQMKFTEQQRKSYRLDRQLLEMEDEYFKDADNLITTAEQRPNAYLPDNNCDLPIPRPYGKYAPFKPSEQGSNFRHFQKPKKST
ncbi:hypothetical protein Ahia01_000054900 [Argonauta hians]